MIFTVENFSGSIVARDSTMESFEKPAMSVMAPAGMVSVYFEAGTHSVRMCQRRSCAVSRTMRSGTSSWVLSG